jgi:membrane dipeptidase
MALDLSHLADTSFAQALEHFDGRVFGSHSNCRALVPGPRQFSDRQIRQIIERRGVIGMVLHSPMLRAGLKPETYLRRQVTLTHLAQHVDHVCQLAGDARHVGLGSDLDGGFGRKHTPAGIDTIADLPKLADVLTRRGYKAAEIAAILHGNWVRFWTEALPKGR